MKNLETATVTCPYCGESTEVDVEPLEEVQAYIEDCSVCCRPMQLEVNPSEDGVQVVATRSD